jgi:hypothetical protein
MCCTSDQHKILSDIFKLVHIDLVRFNTGFITVSLSLDCLELICGSKCAVSLTLKVTGEGIMIPRTFL